MHIQPGRQPVWYGNRMKPGFHRDRLAGIFLAVLLCAASLLPTAARQAEQNSQASGQEVVANLAAGRVVVLVVKDAILLATVENPIESETMPPAPVEMQTMKAGVILGPIDWFSPSTQLDIARLDKELPHLTTHLVATTPPTGPHLGGAPQGGEQASAIEATGLGVGERLNQIAKGLRTKLNLPADEPFLQLIIADYVGGYGPEVWQLAYGVKQEQQKGEYWETRVLRPSYVQFWPPEKGQPKTLMEFSYPIDNKTPTLLQLLQQKDPRLEKVRNSDPQMAMVASQIQTDSSKLFAANATQYLRAALAAVTPPQSRQTLAIIGMERGFTWILAPPPPPERTRPAQTAQAVGQPQQPKERPADSPSLLKH
jgi:hypothetical protein